MRFLILSAGMGSGHDAVAAVLASRLEEAGHETIRADILDLLPAGIGGGLRAAYGVVISRVPLLYAGIYRAFFRDGKVFRPGSAPLAALAEDPLLDLVSRHRADVVVSVFHLGAQVTGRLRAQGKLTIPSAVVMTEFEPHRQWLHPSNDLYLCPTEEIAAAVRHKTGCPAAGTGPLVDARFTESAGFTGSPGFTAQGFPEPPESEFPGSGRRLIPEGRPLVLLSTGAWGVGSSLSRTAALLVRAGYAPAILCGQNERLRQRLSSVPGATAYGWVDDMPALMRSAAALVDNAAGQTAMEALAIGLPVIGYRPIPGHGATGVRLMASLHLSDHARNADDLLVSLRTLTSPGPARDRRIAEARAIFRPGATSALASLGHRDQPAR